MQANPKDNAFCGMWKDRADMKNVDNYVRNLRKGRHLLTANDKHYKYLPEIDIQKFIVS